MDPYFSETKSSGPTTISPSGTTGFYVLDFWGDVLSYGCDFLLLEVQAPMFILLKYYLTMNNERGYENLLITLLLTVRHLAPVFGTYRMFRYKDYYLNLGRS